MGLFINLGNRRGSTREFSRQVNLRLYYKSDKWINRRNEYLESVDNKSEISKEYTNIVHHLKYPDLSNRDNWGSEKDRDLMAVTYDEHKRIHSKFNDISKFKQKLIKAFK